MAQPLRPSSSSANPNADDVTAEADASLVLSSALLLSLEELIEEVVAGAGAGAAYNGQKTRRSEKDSEREREKRPTGNRHN